ncbi:MAG: hypothetical protein G01um101448_516 [Parcubacteria group bacterium Gr01-1014_48]|nr:MAG: hypothetical protein Greene041614_188 [Parcubacteria group bacterium Greene0416_14]TSC73827.1 MAG: hypothetical protein G01um101448_516 [Parcubacteria group bacterium Gr01-1014_48]TSD01208.1 MAG: hypothetical protein Greene101415_403 [Parcubacteria group bacterium Greene1014_15]TSD07316.1 MAG: hypothetical protein Greene07144_949 [Parcubacteria group bacterium Greene0714_4]
MNIELLVVFSSVGFWLQVSVEPFWFPLAARRTVWEMTMREKYVPYNGGFAVVANRQAVWFSSGEEAREWLHSKGYSEYTLPSERYRHVPRESQRWRVLHKECAKCCVGYTQHTVDVAWIRYSMNVRGPFVSRDAWKAPHEKTHKCVGLRR